MRRSSWCFLALIQGLASTAAQGGETEAAVPVPGTSFERHVIKDGIGRDVTYYISRPKIVPAPLMLMIQGSGCVPVMNARTGGTASTLFNLLPFGSEGRFAVVAVEKPFSAHDGGRAGTANGCSASFNDSFTAESWLLALQASLQDARKSSWVDSKRTLVFGASEGAVMATMLAAKDARITDVVAIGGSGTTQLYDFIAHAYRTCFNVAACLADVETKVRTIAADPASSTAFAWGHPHKRWTSFFRVDPGEELLRSKARVYLAFGTADNAVPALSQEVAVAKLMAAHRDVTVRRVPDADHSLRQANAANLGDLDKESRAALDWFWQSK